MESKHIVTLSKVKTYITDNILPQLQSIDSSELGKAEMTEYIDALGNLEKISKIIAKYLADAKKELDFTGKKEIFGNSYKAKLNIASKVHFEPEQVRNELSKTDFLKCVSVIKKNLSVFLPKEKIKELEIPNGTTERISFESLS